MATCRRRVFACGPTTTTARCVNSPVAMRRTAPVGHTLVWALGPEEAGERSPLLVRGRRRRHRAAGWRAAGSTAAARRLGALAHTMGPPLAPRPPAQHDQW